MPNENEKSKKTEQQNLPPDEIDDSVSAGKSTDSKKSFLILVIEFFKHFLPALKEAIAAGAKTFKRRVQGVTEPEQTESEQTVPEQSGVKEEKQKDARPGVDETEDEGGEKSLPEQQAGFFKSKLTAVFKKRKLLIAFSIALIIIIPVWGGLYMGGMFDADEDEAVVKNDKPAVESGKPVSAAPKEESRKGSLFESFFGKKSKTPATPEEQLAAMHINRNPNNFVKYAGQNDITVVKLFIQSGMPPGTARPIDGFTALMAAATFDRTIIAEFLLEKGADINAQDIDGQTALIKAVRHKRHYMVEMLLENKADYNIADKEGNTALSLAKEQYGNNPMTKAFEKFGIDISDTKKELVKDETPKPISPESNSEAASAPTPTPTPSPTPESAPPKPKSKRYQEVSVEEFLKFIQSTDNR